MALLMPVDEGMEILWLILISTVKIGSGALTRQRVLASGSYSNNDGLRLDKLFIQKDNATLHADGSILGPLTNLNFAVLNFAVGLIPALVQALESSTRLDSLSEAMVDTNQRYFAHGGRFERYSCKTRM